MATTKTIKTRLQLIGGNGLEWAGKTLLKNEIGVEWGYTITGQDAEGNDIIQSTNELIGIKIGDGTSKWEELDYFGGEDAHVFTRLLAAEGEQHNDILPDLSSEDSEYVIGDIAIVEEEIGSGTGKYVRTAYVVDENAEAELVWKALDGNINADNVYFAEDLATSYSVGKITTSNKVTKTISAKGQNLTAVWNNVFVDEVNTSLQNTTPSCTVTATAEYIEVGKSSTAQTATLTLAKGSYDYGYGYVTSKDEADPVAGTKAVTVVTNDGTGVVLNTDTGVTTYSATYNNTPLTLVSGKTNQFTVPSVTKNSRTSLSITGKVAYKNAGNPVSNLGKIYPAQAYADGTGTGSKTVAYWYYPIFSGFTYDGAEDAGKQVVNTTTGINETRIRQFSQLASDKAYNYSNNKVSTATAEEAWRQYFYAFPANYGWVMKDAKDGNNIDCTVTHTTVNLTFGTETVAYDVYYIHNATPYGTLKITWTI